MSARPIEGISIRETLFFFVICLELYGHLRCMDVSILFAPFFLVVQTVILHLVLLLPHCQFEGSHYTGKMPFLLPEMICTSKQPLLLCQTSEEMCFTLPIFLRHKPTIAYKPLTIGPPPLQQAVCGNCKNNFRLQPQHLHQYLHQPLIGWQQQGECNGGYYRLIRISHCEGY